MCFIKSSTHGKSAEDIATISTINNFTACGRKFAYSRRAESTATRITIRNGYPGAISTCVTGRGDARASSRPLRESLSLTTTVNQVITSATACSFTTHSSINIGSDSIYSSTRSARSNSSIHVETRTFAARREFTSNALCRARSADSVCSRRTRAALVTSTISTSGTDRAFSIPSGGTNPSLVGVPIDASSITAKASLNWIIGVVVLTVALADNTIFTRSGIGLDVGVVIAVGAHSVGAASRSGGAATISICAVS
jgi:hypothetical protein